MTQTLKIDTVTGLKIAPRYGLHTSQLEGYKACFTGTVPSELNGMTFENEIAAKAHANAAGWHCGNPS